MGDVTGGEVLGDPVGHLPAELGEVVAREPAVEDPVRVGHLTVPHQVDDGDVTVVLVDVVAHSAVASAAARAAAGRASAMRWTACSSCAVDTNQDSKDEGGR